MLVSAQSEDNQTELRTQRAHWSLQSVLELGWPQGFTATSQLGVGWKEDAKRNFVKKYMWIIWKFYFQFFKEGAGGEGGGRGDWDGEDM